MENSWTTKIFRNYNTGGGASVEDQVLRLLDGAEDGLAAPLKVVRARAGLKRPAPSGDLVIAGDKTLARARVEGEAATREVFKERALTLARDLVRHLGHDRVQVARIRVICPLVRTIELLRRDAAVLQILRVST